MLQTKLKARLRAGEPGHGRARAVRDHRAAGPAQPGRAADRLRAGQLDRAATTTSTTRATDAVPEGRPFDTRGYPWRRRPGPRALRHHDQDLRPRHDHPRRGAPPRRRRPRRCPRPRPAGGRSAARPCPSGSWPPASARASTSTAPSATRRSGRATSARSSAATTGSSPASVYTKGFLRNYALYLGLDPDEVLLQWRARARRRRRPERAVDHRPAAARRRRARGLTFSLGLLVAAALTVAVVAVRRLSRRPAVPVRASRPTVAVTDPSTAVVDRR